MTSEEARQQLDECENQITSAYSNLQNTARNMGVNTVQAARKETAMSAVFPLFTFLFGIVLCFTSLRLLGIFLILGGVYAAYNASTTAMSVQNKVEHAVSNLSKSLNGISEI